MRKKSIDSTSVGTKEQKEMKKSLRITIFTICIISSVAAIAVVGNIARSEFSQYSPIIMGISIAVVIIVLYYLKDKLLKK